MTHKRTRGDKVAAEIQSARPGFPAWPDSTFCAVFNPTRLTLLVHAPRNHPALDGYIKRLQEQLCLGDLQARTAAPAEGREG